MRKALRFSFSFLFFFPFLPEGSGASWARDKHEPAVGSSRPSCPEERHGKVPAAYIGSGFPGGGGDVEVSRRCAIWVRGSSCGFLWAPSSPPLPFQMDFETSQSKLASGFPVRERNAYFCCSRLCLPSCGAEPVPPGHPSRMSSYPTTSRTLPSCIHPTDIYGASLGPKLQVMPLCRA